jgi:hypothetical protein
MLQGLQDCAHRGLPGEQSHYGWERELQRCIVRLCAGGIGRDLHLGWNFPHKSLLIGCSMHVKPFIKCVFPTKNS